MCIILKWIGHKMKKRRIVFLTGTRADYGKIKSLIRVVEDMEGFEACIFATGMHMLSKYGRTYKEILKDGYQNIYTYINQSGKETMDIILSNTILGFGNYVAEMKPDAIIVHGDRLEALAGAIVGAFNNIRVFHIEGGEVSGTIDESIRHAITKFAHYHLVSNDKAKRRIMQLGEAEDNIYVFGSPDIDVMLSDSLPDIDTVRIYYEIPFRNYAILMYHPVTTEVDSLQEHIRAVVDGVLESGQNYMVIYPNNDSGTNIILRELERLEGNPRFRVLPSMRFEFFLSLLKHANYIIGNSSSGIREAGVYGVPAIDIGSRQMGRYIAAENPHIIHVEEDVGQIKEAIRQAMDMRIQPSFDFGNGNSTEVFQSIITDKTIWEKQVQKRFIDMAND